MSDIPDDIIAKARGVALDVFANGSDSLDAPVAADIIAAALLSERTEHKAEIARLKNELVAAWNAFGSPSPRTEKPVFDVDDLDHLSRSADGELDEQIRALEDQFAASKARVAELEKALKPVAGRAGRYDQTVYPYGDDDWATITIGELRAARAALTPAKENTDDRR